MKYRYSVLCSVCLHESIARALWTLCGHYWYYRDNFQEKDNLA